MKNPIYPLTNAKLKQAIPFPKGIRVLLLGLVFVTCQSSFAQSKYVKKYQPMADSLSEAYGIPVTIILGVAIMESGAGKSRNCILLNNHFGMEGKNDLLKTRNIKTRYKQYPHALASYADFCKLMTRKKFYKKLKGNMDYKLWADAISKVGYSEIPEEWKKRLLAIIKKSKLTKSKKD